MTRAWIVLILTSVALAQVPVQPPNPVAVTPPAQTFLQSLLDPMTLSLAAYDLSQVAMSATAWKWTMAGKTYSVSAPRVTGITFAATIGGAALAHRWPKLKVPLTIALGGVAAYYAGVAMSQAQNHGAQK